MSASAQELLTLTEPERELIVELLERERKDLPAELRHTDSSEYRDRLRARQHLVDQLLERLRPAS